MLSCLVRTLVTEPMSSIQLKCCVHCAVRGGLYLTMTEPSPMQNAYQNSAPTGLAILRDIMARP